MWEEKKKAEWKIKQTSSTKQSAECPPPGFGGRRRREGRGERGEGRGEDEKRGRGEEGEHANFHLSIPFSQSTVGRKKKKKKITHFVL